ncbi:MAG: hypothetical protein J1E99_05680 [Muribaculaceae bacterium]|nr:hypothetical protein [Muribaculaceae bacterium]
MKNQKFGISKSPLFVIAQHSISISQHGQQTDACTITDGTWENLRVSKKKEDHLA